MGYQYDPAGEDGKKCEPFNLSGMFAVMWKHWSISTVSFRKWFYWGPGFFLEILKRSPYFLRQTFFRPKDFPTPDAPLFFKFQTRDFHLRIPHRSGYKIWPGCFFFRNYVLCMIAMDWVRWILKLLNFWKLNLEHWHVISLSEKPPPYAPYTSKLIIYILL